MPASLLDSQLAALEPDASALIFRKHLLLWFVTVFALPQYAKLEIFSGLTLPGACTGLAAGMHFVFASRCIQHDAAVSSQFKWLIQSGLHAYSVRHVLGSVAVC